MARPGERMRLKDRILDNISKTIKSIQELVYYQYKDPLLVGCDDSVVLYNSNRLCHKLCENLDHTLLHGLKNVMRGYWRVVKQLSPHAMVKEIDLLVNVTTDLGKGRAWLYASLNEGLLESYIRLLCDNDKLLKKYYAKEALVLDRDRMSVLLTLASGLDCVTFKLEYDLPYLDLNAYPPRSRSNSEQDGDVSSDSSDSYLGHPCRYRSMSEIFPNSPLADFQLTNDSDSASLASLDVCQMKASTISADSGFPTDGMCTNGTRQSSLVSVETVINAAHHNGTSADSTSLSSLSSSSGDPDRHQRLENVSSSLGQNDNAPLLEVIHMKGKKVHPGKSKRKKVERSSSEQCDIKDIQSDFHSQVKYFNSKKVNLAVGKGSNERIIKNVANCSALTNSHMVKNVSCHCRQRENCSNTSLDISTAGFKREPDSHICNFTSSSAPSSSTSKFCAENSDNVLPLSLEMKGHTSSGSESLPKSSNITAGQDGVLSSRSESLPKSLNIDVGQDGVLSSGFVCLSNSSNISVMQNGSPVSEHCGSNASDVACSSEASSENSRKGSFLMGISLLPDSCVGVDLSFKSIKETPTAALMPATLGQPNSCVANRVNVDCEDDKTVIGQRSQSDVVCDVSQLSVASGVQSQPNVTVHDEQVGAGDQNKPDVTCVQSQADVTCVQSQADVICVQSQTDVTCVQSQADVTCVQSQTDVIYVQSQANGSCLQSQQNEPCIQGLLNEACHLGQPDVPSVPNPHIQASVANKPHPTSIESQETGACAHSQLDVPSVPTPHIQASVANQPHPTSIESQQTGACAHSQLDVPSVHNQQIQSGVTDFTHHTHSSGCDEQVNIIKSTTVHNGNRDSDFSCQAEDDVDVYSSNKKDASGESHSMPKSLEQSCEVSSVRSLTYLEDDITVETAESAASIDTDRQEAYAEDVDLSLRLDNNMVLQLMLDVFCQEDEQLLKMFVTWENQTEGGTNVVYLLISNHCLYVLHYQRTVKKFVQQSCILLIDIIFLSVGLNGQTLNIESRGKNKQKQRLWLTPGNYNLSQAIIACLADAVKTANEHSAGKSRFSVGSEVPLQKIALRKYISKELSIKAQDVTLLDYSLVFWEDLSSASSSGHSGVYKEGKLHLWTQGPLKSHVWKPVYVVLKNNILSLKNDKSDLRPHCFLSLGGDQCVGCRLTSHPGRDHCVELILAQGSSWLLSGASQADISEWRHCLCLAVSQGTVESEISPACVPCCALLANQHLFLCHEDLYSKFHRTLARLRLEDVNMIAVDGTDSTYCVVKLKAQETVKSSRQWAFYFYSNQDMERHISAMRTAWKDIHQAELPVLPMDDIAMECSCNSCSNQLKRQLTLS